VAFLCLVAVSDLKGWFFAGRNTANFESDGNHCVLAALSYDKFIDFERAMMLCYG